MTSLSWIRPCLIVGALVAFIAAVMILFPFTVDDSYITYRYAQNVVHGDGPTYNPGGSRVEGYTSVAWMLSMTIPEALGIPTPIFAKVAGIACTLLTLVVLVRLVHVTCAHLGESSRHWAAAIAVFALATFHPTAVHAVSGMETALCTLLLTGFVYLFISRLPDSATVTGSDAPDAGQDTRRCVSLAAIGIALGVTRPEMNIVVVLGLAIVLMERGPRFGRRLLCVAIVYVVPAALYYAWRLHYYGLAFPLPFYVKGGGDAQLSGAKDSLSYALHFVSRFGIFIAAAFVVPNRHARWLASAALLLLVFYAIPRSIMNYDWRYQYVTAPLLIALAAAGSATIIEILREASHAGSRYARVLSPPIVAVVVCAVFFASGLSTAAKSYRAKLQYARGLRDAHEPLGRLLWRAAQATGPGTLGITDAGLVPYLSRWKTIDTFGLNDRAIALRGSADMAYLDAQNLDLLVVLSEDEAHFRPKLPGEAGLYEFATARHMEKLGTLRFASDYYLWIMLNGRGPLVTAIREEWRIAREMP